MSDQVKELTEYQRSEIKSRMNRTISNRYATVRKYCEYTGETDLVKVKAVIDAIAREFEIESFVEFLNYHLSLVSPSNDPDIASAIDEENKFINEYKKVFFPELEISLTDSSVDKQDEQRTSGDTADHDNDGSIEDDEEWECEHCGHWHDYYDESCYACGERRGNGWDE